MIGEGLCSRARLGRLASKTAKLRKQQGEKPWSRLMAANYNENQRRSGGGVRDRCSPQKNWQRGEGCKRHPPSWASSSSGRPKRSGLGRFHSAPQRRPSSERPYGNAELLEKIAVAHSRLHPHLGGGCKGYVFEDGHSRGVPGPSRFSHHGHKCDALGGAGIQGLQVLFLVAGISFSRCRRVPPCLSQGLLMAKSNAAGDPAKAGRYTSAGRRRAVLVASSGEVGRSRPGRSRSGRRPPRFAQVYTRSRTAWCRWVRSPPAAHIPAWWLWWSRIASQSGHQVSVSASGTCSRTRSSATNAAGSMRVGPLGKALRKARPPREGSDNKVARPTTVVLANCSFHPAASSRCDNLFWLLAMAVSKGMACSGGNWLLKAAKAATTSGCAVAVWRQKLWSRAAAASKVEAQEARKAAAAWVAVDRNPSPPWPNPREACAHCWRVRWSPVKSPKLRRTMPSNMSSAMCWAVGGLQRMLWRCEQTQHKPATAARPAGLPAHQ